MKKAFTLIELVVAVALLAMVLSFASVIFRVSIEAYRTAGANTEIMQKLRAITDQLNADFKGLRTDAPLLIWFKQDTSDHEQRYDQIMFFAGGDFQSTQLYNAVPDPAGNRLVIGNVARIHYGQAQDNDLRDPQELSGEDRLLARRQHILTADADLWAWPDEDLSDFQNKIGGLYVNEIFEHDRLSLAQWKTIDGGVYDSVIVDTCFEFRPLIDMSDPNTFHKLMCEGVGSFTIQGAYWDSDDKRFYWFPSNDPDGDGDDDDSSFVGNDEFGVFFNIPNGDQFGDWYLSSLYPKVLKFTFTLYDSKGILENGRRFTHIVYVGN